MEGMDSDGECWWKRRRRVYHLRLGDAGGGKKVDGDPDTQGGANGLIGGPPCRVSLGICPQCWFSRVVPVACYWGCGDLVGSIICAFVGMGYKRPRATIVLVHVLSGHECVHKTRTNTVQK